MATKHPDPVMLEIMRNRWRGIADEGCAAMIRTSYSPNIKDRYDCSTALALPDGQVLAQAEIGTPLHLGIMPSVISSVLHKFPAATIRPGDAIITNLPYPEGPGHLPDLSMVSAVWHAGNPIVLVATTAHHIDMELFAPGSMPFGVTEIYQEGLQVPPTRIIRAGTMDEAIFDLIHQNGRTHNEMHGDLMAQYAAAQAAEQRIAELLDREDPALVLQYLHPILDHAERGMRKGIHELPNGSWTFEDFLDDDGVTEDPVRIFLTLTVQDDELIADFTGSSKQFLGHSMPGSLLPVHACTTRPRL